MTEQAATGELGPGAVLEGGDTDSERRCTFLEIALSLAGGLSPAALATLYKAAIPAIQEKDPAVQKKGYRILAYITEHRPDYMGLHFKDVLGTLIDGKSPASEVVFGLQRDFMIDFLNE